MNSPLVRWSLALCLASALFPVSARPHGGVYRGPGDPGTRGSADTMPPAPSAGNPRGRSGGAGTGGGPRGVVPVPTAPGPNSTSVTPAMGAQPDASEWTVWWGFNQDPFLDLKRTVWSRGLSPSEASWFLVRANQVLGAGYWQPSATQVADTVVPALQRTLETETNNDIVTGCLVALARIGAARADLAPSIHAAIRPFLRDSVQEIAETAAVCLGILGTQRSSLVLDHLLLDDEHAREILCGGPVHFRTRAFAAYGLGLLGAQTSHEGVRAHVLATLVHALSDPSLRTDVQVAAVIAFGMTPVETMTAPEVNGTRPAHTSRLGQLEFLMELYDRRHLPALVLAHVPTSLARLVDGLPPDEDVHYREWITSRLLESLASSNDTPNEVLEGVVIALGHIGDNDADPLDTRIRAALTKVPDHVADARCRNQSLIALGHVGARFGPGAKTEEVREGVVAHLTRALQRGRQTQRPWAGLALGVLARESADAGHSVPPSIGRALQRALEGEGNPTRASAYAVGLGLARHREATPLLVDRLQEVNDEFALGSFAVALGLMRADAAREPIQRLAADARFRPTLLRDAATALGLLGDESLAERLKALLLSTDSLATQASLARALGHVGDGRTIDALVGMLTDDELTDRARGFAAVALGLISDPALLPWNARLSVDLNYRAACETLNDASGTGILNIL